METGNAYAFLNTPAAELSPSFSPDGRWIAYQSNEPGGLRCTCARFRSERAGGSIQRWRSGANMVEGEG